MSAVDEIQEYFNDNYWDDEPLSKEDVKVILKKLEKLGYYDGAYTLIEVAVEEFLNEKGR